MKIPLRPRISILTALLLMTILGMALVIIQLWREVGPLRAELAARRAEMGQLFVTDQTKAHAIGIDWNQDGMWRWRLFLPERPHRGNTWVLRTYVGKQPAFDGDGVNKWLVGPKKGENRIWSTMGGVPAGREFTYELQLGKDEDGWFLREKGGRKHDISKSFDTWLDKPKLQYPTSLVISSEQKIYKQGEPIVLLCVQRANESRTGGSDGDTIIVWIEEDR